MNISFQEKDFDEEMLATRFTNQMLNICFQGEDFDEEMATIDPESVEHGKDILTILGFVVILIILELLGNGFLYGIFVYEKFGIDTQRRTIINMLLSQAKICSTGPTILKIKTIIVKKQNIAKMPFVYYLPNYKSISNNSAALTSWQQGCQIMDL